MSSNLLDGSSCGRKARPAGFDDKARCAERLPAAAFSSERVWMAHQKVATVPERATAASIAVKRDAPNALIAAIRRFAPYCLGSCTHCAGAPPRSPTARCTPDRRTHDAIILCRRITPEIRPNPIFCVAHSLPLGTRASRPLFDRGSASIGLLFQTKRADARAPMTSRCGRSPNQIAAPARASQAGFFASRCLSVVERRVLP
jgi:hypothetical protein